MDPVKKKTIDIDADDREFTELSLKAAGISYGLHGDDKYGDSVTLAWDDLVRIVLQMHDDHYQLHVVRSQLSQIYPVVQLADQVDAKCEARTEVWPISDEMRVFAEKKERAARLLHQQGAQAMFASMFGKPSASG